GYAAAGRRGDRLAGYSARCRRDDAGPERTSAGVAGRADATGNDRAAAAAVAGQARECADRSGVRPASGLDGGAEAARHRTGASRRPGRIARRLGGAPHRRRTSRRAVRYARRQSERDGAVDEPADRPCRPDHRHRRPAGGRPLALARRRSGLGAADGRGGAVDAVVGRVSRAQPECAAHRQVGQPAMTRSLLAVVAVLLLAGCGSTPTRVFDLSPAIPTEAIADQPAHGGPLIWVDKPSVAGYFDRTQMVTRGAGSRISIHEFEIWSDPPADLIQRAVVDELARRFGADQVMRTPVAHYATPAWR